MPPDPELTSPPSTLNTKQPWPHPRAPTACSLVPGVSSSGCHFACHSTAYMLFKRTTRDTREWGRLQRLHCAYGACPRGPSTLSLQGSHRLNLRLNKAKLLDECSWNYRRPPDCVTEGSPWHQTAILDG